MRVMIGLMVMILAAFSSAGIQVEAQAQDRKQKAEALVGRATESLQYFASRSTYRGLWQTADDAKAMVIIPKSYRAGFLFGGSGGTAVVIARNNDGSWSGPTFMSVGSFSFGLQAGGEVSEIVLLAMTERGKEGLLSSSVKLGGDMTIAAGPVGLGAKAKTADILAFSRSRGLYGGLSLEGSILDTKKRWNRAYYGADVTAVDVVYKGVRDNPVSLPLRQAAYDLSTRSVARPVDQSGVLTNRSPEAQQLAKPTQVIPPAGRVYSAPGQIQSPQPGTVGTSDEPYRPYDNRQYAPTDQLVTPARTSTLPPLEGAPIDEPIIYEDDEAFGVPLQRTPAPRP